MLFENNNSENYLLDVNYESKLLCNLKSKSIMVYFLLEGYTKHK